MTTGPGLRAVFGLRPASDRIVSCGQRWCTTHEQTRQNAATRRSRRASDSGCTKVTKGHEIDYLSSSYSAYEEDEMLQQTSPRVTFSLEELSLDQENGVSPTCFHWENRRNAVYKERRLDDIRQRTKLTMEPALPSHDSP